jgi:hypothetical protein
MNNINDNDNLVEIYCDITSQIKNSEPEAFNLVCLLKGNRVAYLLKSYQNLHKYLLFKNYISQLNISYLGYVEISDNSPKLLIYNDAEIEKQPILCEYLENIINNEPDRKQYISYLLQHMCPNQNSNYRGSIEYYIKNFNKTIYKEYCQHFPENNLIQEKLNQFQEIGDLLSLKIDVKTDRYIHNNEVLDIILRKSLPEYHNFKKEIKAYLKKYHLLKTGQIIDRILMSNDSIDLLLKYHRKIGVLVTLTSYEVYSAYQPLTRWEIKHIKEKMFQLENDIYAMNIERLTTRKISNVVISYLKEIILWINESRRNNTLFNQCNNFLKSIYDRINN